MLTPLPPRSLAANCNSSRVTSTEDSCGDLGCSLGLGERIGVALVPESTVRSAIAMVFLGYDVVEVLTASVVVVEGGSGLPHSRCDQIPCVKNDQIIYSFKM